MNAKAPLDDQRTLLVTMRCMETMEDESVRESELLKKSAEACVGDPAECVKELRASGRLYRTRGPSGTFLRRTED